jgi:hypothetical protein
MKFIEKRTLQVCLFAAAVAVIALATPRAARAVASTLVQVTNSFSNPAIVQPTSTAASQMVMLAPPLNGEVTSGAFVTLNPVVAGQGVTSSTYVVPAGQNLVVTGMDVTVYSGSADIFLLTPTSGLGQGIVQVYATSAGTQMARFPGIVYPAGDNVVVESSSIFGNAAAAIVVYGYLTAN